MTSTADLNGRLLVPYSTSGLKLFSANRKNPGLLSTASRTNEGVYAALFSRTNPAFDLFGDSRHTRIVTENCRNLIRNLFICFVYATSNTFMYDVLLVVYYAGDFNDTLSAIFS